MRINGICSIEIGGLVVGWFVGYDRRALHDGGVKGFVHVHVSDMNVTHGGMVNPPNIF